jgi:hypothetical protein
MRQKQLRNYFATKHKLLQVCSFCRNRDASKKRMVGNNTYQSLQRLNASLYV